MRIRDTAAAGLVGVVVAVGLAGCSSTPTTGTRADGGPSTPATAGATGQSSNASQDGRDTTPGTQPSGSSSASGGSDPSQGTYDDTSGTSSKSPKSQAVVLDSLPGPSASRCVPVGSRSNVRSGDLAMGDFAQAGLAFRKAKSAYDADPSTLYVIPRSSQAHSVTVVATRLGSHQTPVRIHSDQVEQAAQWSYFPVQVQIPSAGTWRFVVTVGSERGCFDAKFST